MILCRCFDCEEHAEEFLCGKIRMMSLEYYRKKEADENGRKDKYEGAQKFWQGEHTTVKIDDIEISGKDGLLSIVLRSNEHEQDTKICCCTLLDVNMQGVNTESLKEFKLPYCIVFVNPDEFLNRFKKAAKGLAWKTGKVLFYDDKSYNGDLHEFMKPKSFQWQNEFRLALIKNERDPFYLEIGDIHSLARLYKTEDLIKELDNSQIYKK